MATLGLIAATLFGGVLLVLIVLVATPLHLALLAESGAAARAQLSVRTLWGLSPALRLSPDTGRTWRERPKRRKRKRKPGRRRKPWLGRGMALPRLASLRALIERITVDRLALDLRFGTGDPAETGWLYGYLIALAHAVPIRTGAIRLHPDFGAAVVEGRAEARLHFTPLALVFPTIRVLRDVSGGRA